MHVIADQPDAVRPDHIGAARAAEIAPVDHQGLQHDRERERRDGEEGAAQPQRQIAHAETGQAGHDAAEQHQQRNRQRIGLVKEHRRIGAEREEGGRAEIHIAGIAAQNVPGLRQHDELEDHVAGEECVVVADKARGAEHTGRDHDAHQEEDRGTHDRLSYRPNRPTGRTARVKSRKPNATAGAHEGP